MKKEELRIIKDSLLDVVKHEIGNPKERNEAARILLDNFGSSEAEINLNDLAETIKAAQQATRDTCEATVPRTAHCTHQPEKEIEQKESEFRHQELAQDRAHLRIAELFLQFHLR